MTGTVNTQAAEFPEDGPVPHRVDASEFRDLDNLSDLVPAKSTEFASGMNAGMNPVKDMRADAIAGRRTYANGPQLSTETVVSGNGARNYSARIVYLTPGTAEWPGAHVLLLGDDATRQRIVLCNVSLDYVRIGPLGQIANGTGFALPPGEHFESSVTQAIYACVPQGILVAAEISVWSENA